MATRIENIITRARDTLADPGAQRWSDDRLVRLVNEAQEDIAKQSRLLKGQATLTMEVGKHTYDLPSDIWLLTRATFNFCPIKLYSYDNMDEYARKEILSDSNYTEWERHTGYQTDNVVRECWEDDEGSSIEALIYDRRNMQEIRVYPIPNEGITESTYTFQNSGFLDTVFYVADTPYGVLTDTEEPDSLIEVVGVTTDAQTVDYIITDPDGCNGIELVTDTTFSSPFGIFSDVEDNIKVVAFKGDEVFGVVVGIDDYTLDSVYGLTTDLYDPSIQKEVFSSPYGVVTGINESVGVVDIWYIRMPTEVTKVTDDLEIPSMFDTLIKHFVVAHAFDDDMDTRFQEKSQKALSYYQRDLAIAIKTDRQDGTRASQFNTSYRSAFE